MQRKTGIYNGKVEEYLNRERGKRPMPHPRCQLPYLSRQGMKICFLNRMVELVGFSSGGAAFSWWRGN